MDKEAIKEAFAEVLKEERKSFWIEPETHYLDHKYVSEVRHTGKQVKAWSLRVVVVSITAGIIAWITMHLKGG